jgi:hypothetical protein
MGGGSGTLGHRAGTRARRPLSGRSGREQGYPQLLWTTLLTIWEELRPIGQFPGGLLKRLKFSHIKITIKFNIIE